MDSSQSRRIIAAGMIGNVLEWYDFAVYGYFATAIGRHFFPHEDAVAQLLSAFGVFAIGYVMRPVGGAVVGHIGDRFGRRAALTFSVAVMAIPTFLIGLLPGYATLGVAARLRSRCCVWCRGFRSAASIRARWCSWWSTPRMAAAA
jgi:MFS transporter, MHS family, proline/betaine transporter